MKNAAFVSAVDAIRDEYRLLVATDRLIPAIRLIERSAGRLADQFGMSYWESLARIQSACRV